MTSEVQQDPAATFLHVRVEGGPKERGRAYGEQARVRIHRSIEAYTEVFVHYAGWDWAQVVGEAVRYREPIARFSPKYLEVEASRSSLGEPRFTAAWERGRRMPLEEAVDGGLGEVPISSA